MSVTSDCLKSSRAEVGLGLMSLNHPVMTFPTTVTFTGHSRVSHAKGRHIARGEGASELLAWAMNGATDIRGAVVVVAFSNASIHRIHGLKALSGRAD
jgi:hypothetical protein